jgi:SEC-C motif
MYITEGEPYRPEAVIWLELPSELVIGWTLIDPKKPPPSFADTLREAMRSPDEGPPRRPGRVRVADEKLAAEVRSVFAGTTGPIDATEIVVAPTPEIDAIVRLVAESSGPGDEKDSYLEGGRVSPQAAQALLATADLLYRAAPWKVANDGQLVRLDVPDFGVAGAAISVIGALGEGFGFLVFPSLEAHDRFVDAGERLMRRARGRSLPTTIDLGSSVLSLTFGRAADLPRLMRDEVRQHGWPVAGSDAYPRVEHHERDGITRPLTEDDVRLVTACAGALTAFVPRHAAVFQGTGIAPVSESYTGETEFTVRLTAPYESFGLFDDGVDDAADASDLAPGWFSVPFELRRPGQLGGPAEPRPAPVRARTGRNDPCPCGSGKKYKRCHLGADAAAVGGSGTARSGTDAPRETAALHALDGRLADAMAAYARRRFGAEWLRFERDFTDPKAAAQISRHWALYHFRVRGRPVAEHFLVERGDALTGQEREWLDAQSRSWLGIWEVEDAEPGVGLGLHDLLTGERRRVVEASGSRTLVRRSAVLARVVDHGGVALICGSHPQPLPPLEAAAVAQSLRDRLRRGRSSPVERLREERLGRDLIARWEEAFAALEERSRIPPQLHNADGDELVFIGERFDFDPAARPEIEARLAAVDGVVAPEDGDTERDYVFHRPGAPERPGWEDLIVGQVQVREGSLSVETNSVRRADALRARIEAALGDLVRRRRRRRRDAQRMAERAWERPAAADDAGAARGDLAAVPEVQQALRELKEQHYADWPDQPLAALGGKTAREAVRSRTGRDQVDALLKDIEYREARLPAGERFDVTVLRRALGL